MAAPASSGPLPAVEAGPPEDQPHRPIFRRIRLLVSLFFALALPALALLRRWPGDGVWWGALLLALPAVALLPPVALLCLMRPWWTALPAWIGLPVLLFPLMGLRLPFPQPPHQGPRVRALTWNLREGAGGMESLLAAIRRERPDILVLTESRGVGPQRLVRARLAAEFAGWSSIAVSDLFIAARYPKIDSDYRGIDNPALRSQPARLLVSSPLGPLQIVGVHFPSRISPKLLQGRPQQLPQRVTREAALRRGEIEELRRWIAPLPGELLLCGDLNLQPDGPPYWKVRRGLVDSFLSAGAGLGYTYPAHFPLVRIDYILHSPGLRSLRCRVGKAGASDHRYVVAEISRRSGG